MNTYACDGALAQSRPQGWFTPAFTVKRQGGMARWRRRLGVAALGAAMLASLAPAARASLVITGTRVIYNAGSPETTVKMSNEGQAPALMQAWIDDGNAEAKPDEVQVPFFLTPPLARVDPGKGQTLRIFFNGYPDGKTLPSDRESVFWLNVLEVPPKATPEEGHGVLQLTIRSRLKLFYRPKGLSGNPLTAAADLTFKRKPNGVLEVHNPTPYYVNLQKLEVGENGAHGSKTPWMLAPLSSDELRLKGTGAKSVQYWAIDDFGGVTPYQAAIAD
ncbi:fimbrial chaperone [Bordetella pertussis]|nr:molecular chaperone [Bordetella pertussis]PNO97796.1 fimbrial chaperone [Bordetella pertussis 18323]ALX24901.1 molecular chaperone [Bordetella pertussis]AMG21875.1 fimbrial chaperone [Bordetella pertussis]AMS51260.1 molecular chaperone [Bordetella pertussis]